MQLDFRKVKDHTKKAENEIHHSPLLLIAHLFFLTESKSLEKFVSQFVGHCPGGAVDGSVLHTAQYAVIGTGTLGTFFAQFVVALAALRSFFFFGLTGSFPFRLS